MVGKENSSFFEQVSIPHLPVQELGRLREKLSWG